MDAVAVLELLQARAELLFDGEQPFSPVSCNFDVGDGEEAVLLHGNLAYLTGCEPLDLSVPDDKMRLACLINLRILEGYARLNRTLLTVMYPEPAL